MSIEIDFETRHVQLTGRATYIVSLPKKWVVDNRLDRDKIVYIYRLAGDALLLLPYKLREGELREGDIKVFGEEDIGRLMRMIIAHYIRGYDIIKIYSDRDFLPPLLRNKLKERIRKFLFGSEFLEETAKHLAIHILASPRDIDINTLIIRIADIAANMHIDAMKAMLLRDGDMFREIINRDDVVDRLYFLSMRILNIYSDIRNLRRQINRMASSRELMEYRIVVRHLERVADHATIIATSMGNVKDIYSNKDAETLAQLNYKSVEALKTAVDALIKRDIDKAEKTISFKPMIRDMEEKAVSRLTNYTDPRLIASLRMSIESCRRVFEYSVGIAEIAINLSLS